MSVFMGIWILGVPIAAIIGLVVAAMDSYDFADYVLAALIAIVGSVIWPLALVVLFFWVVFG
ncbi:membrane protein [Mycobacterium phage Estes]|uniref:Membrane protein n=1 Tax=Mycobacterium phage Estes TaxID=2759459 RepID=A0A7G9A284_9CAUD|nr:membrane protein [Mycobacterium phage Estes]QNL30723.1 membrane protein [Mycobacterium phage Estes]